MLIDDRDKKIAAPTPHRLDDAGGHLTEADALPGPSGGSPPPAFPSNSPPPRFDFADSNYFVPPGGEGSPPPDFAPYAAEYFEAGDGSIVSHDPHLNEDGK